MSTVTVKKNSTKPEPAAPAAKPPVKEKAAAKDESNTPLTARELIAAMKEPSEEDAQVSGSTWNVRKPRLASRALLLCVYPDHAVRIKNEVRKPTISAKGVTTFTVAQQGVDLKFKDHHVWIDTERKPDEDVNETLLERVVRTGGYGFDFIFALDLLVGLSGRAPKDLPPGIVIGRNSAKGFVRELIRRSWFKQQIESDDFALELRGVVKNDSALLKRIYQAKAGFHEAAKRNQPAEIDD